MGELNGLQDLVDFWKEWPFCWASSGPARYVHPQDRKAFEENPRLEAKGGPEAPGFHLRLRPVPFMGNLLSGSHRADIFLMMTNPVVRQGDYRDNSNRTFKRALQDNLGGYRKTCLALDTDGVGETSWTSYYRNEVLGPTLRDAPDSQQLFENLKRRLAILELVPYYSPNARRITGRLLGSLRSVELMRGAAKHLEARARDGGAHLIVRWPNGWNRWELRPGCDNIVHSPARRGLSECAKRRLLEWLRKGR